LVAGVGFEGDEGWERIDKDFGEDYTKVPTLGRDLSIE